MTSPGGYRPPSNPAPVSGPGAMSARTDGGQRIRDLPDGEYGENKAFTEQQQGAPMAEASRLAPPSPAAMEPMAQAPQEGTPQLPPLTPFTAPTARPDEPITSGVGIGPGPGPVETGIEFQAGSLADALKPFISGDPTGQLARYAQALSERGMW